jgi:hypothetical protein
MTDAQIVILTIFAVIFFIILIFNVVSYPNVKLYKKKYDELKRGVYKFEPSVGHSAYFYLYSYDIATVTFIRTSVNIIFFFDGDIKLTDNLYIHKSHLFMSFVSWYYWRKLQKLKDELISQHNFNEAYSRYRLGYLESLQEQPKIQNKLTFKFFRG